jgi:hypothetical protein
MASDMAAMMATRNDALSADTRLLMLTMERVNIWGHAAFDRGEVAELMGSRDRFRSGKEKLIKAEMIAPESTQLCVVLSAVLYRRGDRRNRCCAEPTHRSRQRMLWLGAPFCKWEHTEGEWEDVLATPEKPENDPQKFAMAVEAYMAGGD